MDMVERSLIALEWPKIRERLEEMTSSALGREAARRISFMSEAQRIEQRLAEAWEMRQLLEEEGEPPLEGIYDLGPLLVRLDKEGVLSSQELLQVYRTLVATSRLRTFFLIRRDRYPHLFQQTAQLIDLKDLRRHLSDCLDESGNLTDSASPLLRQLRRQVQSLQQTIKGRLESIISSPEYSHVLQENYYTIRAGRYVVPIKAEARSKLPGIVHDSSMSGATLFVEPQELVDLNNRLRIAELELEHESYRILRELSYLVADYLPEIRKNLEILASVDLTYAKGRLGMVLDAHPPKINVQGKIKLIKVRHPLLVLGQDSVVANDFSLGDRFQGIIITGPNAGGKTIMLKTVGLCALMTRAGLLIPAAPDSEMPIFPAIYADIGDPQSVEGNLSTFSGHLTNIREILRKVYPGSLVLLDELITSTDPVEGEALAQAIIEKFLAMGVYLVVTTHYNHLKVLASQNELLVNAAMEYDFNHLRPSYRLIFGIPGRSYGMEIADRLGLDPSICQRARELMGQQSQSLHLLLGQLEEQRQLLEKKLREIDREREEVERLEKRLQEELEKVKRQKEQILLEFEQGLSEELDQARRQINSLLEAIKKDRRREKIKMAREELVRLDQEIRSRYCMEDKGETIRDTLLNSCQKGDEVEVISLRQRGILLEEPRDKERVEIQIGSIRLVVDTADLLPVKVPKKQTAKGEPSPRPSSSLATEEIPLPRSDNSCDLRGLTAEEAQREVEQFLDRATLKDLNYVYLIHGHGSGTLKKKIRGYLSHSPYVLSFRPGNPSEGGDGVTVVQLK